ncbi:hypothetical protein BJX70DRAFT_40714 [Aspergillus crustosus]
MKFSASFSTLSDFDQYLSQGEGFSPRSSSSKDKKKREKYGESAYDPQDDELDSPEERNDRGMLAPQKRKLEEEEVSVLNSNISPPPLKRINHGPPNTSNASKHVTKTAKTQPSAANNTPSKKLLAPSPQSDRGSVSSALQKRRKAPSTVVDDRHDRNYVAENSNSDDDDKELEELENKYTIPEDEKDVLYNYDLERDKRLQVVVSIPKNMYTEQEKSLFLQLAMRGFEPLAPKHWHLDFPTLPDSLFPEPGKEKSKPIIETSRSTKFYAIKSLLHLFSLSGRVRDCNLVEKRPEGLIKQTIKRYIRWALYDVNLEIGPGSLPIHVLQAQRKNESILDALQRLNKRLKRLALQHEKALLRTSNWDNMELPLLIGFIVCGPVVAIMALDLNLLDRDPDIDGKFISQFDLSERGQDVWNSLSLTIVIMHIRNTMVRLRDNKYGGYEMSSVTSLTSDDL